MKLPGPAIVNLEAVINHYLALDPETNSRMATLEGRCIGLDLKGIELGLFILPQEQGIQLRSNVETEADAVLHGTPMAMARLSLGGNTEKTLFSGDVTISGDVETGQAFKAILDDMDIDWEEHLAGFTGDMVAHQIGNLARGARRFFERSQEKISRDTGDYLKEELRILPARIEVENFIQDVTTLRSDSDRLAARVKRLVDKQANGKVS